MGCRSRTVHDSGADAVTLEALKQRFSGLLAEYEIREFPATDDAFRLFVPKIILEQVLGQLAAGIEYDKSRTKSPSFKGQQGAAFEHSLHEVCTGQLGDFARG